MLIDLLTTSTSVAVDGVACQSQNIRTVLTFIKIINIPNDE